MYKTEGLIETHFHGAFGIDFMNCEANDFVDVAVEIAKYGITRIYPTLMTGHIGQIKDQIKKVKIAQQKQPKDSALIAGIHLEGPFINPFKKGIHEDKYIVEPSVRNYQKIEDEIIKIVTLAPELDNNRELCKYLHSKAVLVQAGHTMTGDLSECNSVTHFFNAMAPLNHRVPNIISAALSNDEMYIELIADGNHVIDEVLKMVFKAKSRNKIVLISDALPMTHGDSDHCTFAGQDVHNENGTFKNDDGTIAGSGMLTADILKRLVKNDILPFEEAVYMMNITPAKYLNVLNNAYVTFDDDLNPIKTEFIKHH